MKMKWITEKTGKNSGKNRGILGAAGRSLKVFLAAGVLGKTAEETRPKGPQGGPLPGEAGPVRRLTRV